MSVLRVYLTGFGPFHGVNDNPTTELAKQLKAMVEDSPLKDVVKFVGEDVLEVSALECAGYVDKHRFNHSETHEPTLFLHLGVAASRTNICLESTA
jgi:pyrrolidone-carboxylate peptidase